MSATGRPEREFFERKREGSPARTAAPERPSRSAKREG
jgi:hypothetical protein